MRVLVVTQYFWPESFNINDVVRTLGEKGAEVVVLTGKPNYPEGAIYSGYSAWGCQEDSYDGARIQRIPVVARGKSAWRLALNYVTFVISGLWFGPTLLRQESFDVILVYAPSPILQAIPALFLGWLKKTPVTVWVQDLWPESLSATGYVRNRAILNLVERVVRFIYCHADLLLVQSRAFIGPVRTLAKDTPVAYFPNSVADTFAMPVDSRTPPVDGLGEGFSILFAGNIGAAQAVDVIVEAASLLRKHADIHFFVLGDGSRREWMLNEVRQRALTNVHLPGRFPMPTMPGLLQKASALLVTLADRPIYAATVPSKMQAYLATGKPIIASMNGEGARLVIEAKAGLATPAEDPRALATAILRLYRKSPREQEAMGHNGRRYHQEHFDHHRLIDQLISHLQSVSQGHKDTQ